MIEPTRNDIHQNYVTLADLVRANIPLNEDRHKYLNLLEFLADDTTYDYGDGNSFLYLGFKRAPAARGNHHAFEGGLIYHLIEMWNIWEVLQTWTTIETKSGNPLFQVPHYVTDSRVLRAIINHDLHKAYYTYKLVNTNPWTVDYEARAHENLVPPTAQTLQILSKYDIDLDDQQMNALLWSEGGFSELKPKWCSVLAKLCYCLDELSGNVADRIRTGKLLDVKQPEFLNVKEPMPKTS